MKNIYSIFQRFIERVPKIHRRPILVLLCTFGVFFCVLIPQLLIEKENGVYVAYEHLWSDWPLHVAIANRFATTDPSSWFVSHPMYAGGKFSYPFFSDFLSGMFMRIGFSLSLSFTLPTFVFVLFLTIGLYFLWYLVFKKPWISVLAISIFYLSSGMRWVVYVMERLADHDITKALFPTLFYTRIDEYSWYSGNVIVGLFFPQRAFLLGMTIGVWVLVGMVYSLFHKTASNKKRQSILVGSGILAGILPIVHMHSFIAVVVITGLLCLSQYKRWKEWSVFVAVSGLVSIPLFLLLVAGGIENPEFMKLAVGWTAKNGVFGWIKMWMDIWGLSLPLAIVGILKLSDKTHKMLFVGFLCLFLLGNVLLLQPVHWDNSKIFFWSYIGVSGLCATVVNALWQKHILLKVFAFFLFFSLTATGVLDLLRTIHVSENELQIGSTEDILLGKEIQEKTDHDAYFLTGTSTNATPMTWGGRPILLGFTPWVANFGFMADARYVDMRTMYHGGDDAVALFEKYNVSYVVIGPSENHEFNANESFFKANYPVAFTSTWTAIYDVRN